MVCFCTKSTFGNLCLDSEIWAKMLIVNNNCEISRMDHWNSLIFLHVDTNLKRKFLLIFFGVGMAKNWCGQKLLQLFLGRYCLYLNLLYLKIEFMNWAVFLHADSDAIIFYWTDILFYVFDITFKCWESNAVVLVFSLSYLRFL